MPRIPWGVTLQPLSGRMTPAQPMMWGLSRNGRETRSRVSFSSRLSPSMQATRGKRTRFRPQLRASALPPFSLSTTTRLGTNRLS